MVYGSRFTGKMNNKILGDKKKSNFDDNLADYVNQLAEKGELVKPSEEIELFPIDLSKIEFELNVAGAMWNFDSSLKDLRIDPSGFFVSGGKKVYVGRAYDRHPRPREIFEYLRVTSDEICQKHGFINPNPEWTSCAFKKEGSKLFVALDPENFVSDATKTTFAEFYKLTCSGIMCSGKREFDIGNKPIDTWINLEELPKELVTYLYGKSLDGYKPSYLKLLLPRLKFLTERLWLPVSRTKYSLSQDLVAYSRGVKIEK